MGAIAVFGSASDDIAPAYRAAAYEAGLRIAEAGFALVFGAGSTGLMGEAARGARTGGAKVFGFVPGHLNTPEVIDQDCDELSVTEDLRARMAEMERRADGFLALPGGLGTLYEVAEILTLIQLEQIRKPLVLLNTLGAYDALLAHIDGAAAGGFIHGDARRYFGAHADPAAAVAALTGRMRAP